MITNFYLGSALSLIFKSVVGEQHNYSSSDACWVLSVKKKKMNDASPNELGRSDFWRKLCAVFELGVYIASIINKSRAVAVSC